MGRDSRSKGCGFESRQHILHGHFFTNICCKNCDDVCLKKTENKQKEAGVGPFLSVKWDPFLVYKLNIWIQICKAGDQQYNDTSPNGERSQGILNWNGINLFFQRLIIPLGVITIAGSTLRSPWRRRCTTWRRATPSSGSWRSWTRRWQCWSTIFRGSSKEQKISTIVSSIFYKPELYIG